MSGAWPGWPGWCPRLYATPNLREDGSYYAGPFRKASLARRFVDCVNGVYPLRTCAHLPRMGRGSDEAAGGRAGGAEGSDAGSATRGSVRFDSSGSNGLGLNPTDF